MTSPRSRKESKAETRSRLLDVAADVLLEGGYRAASLDKIAEAAGYTKGAVYSNFSGKEELTLLVLDRQMANRLVDLQGRLQTAGDNRTARIDALVLWWEEMLLIEGWGAVVFEFTGATRDNPEVQHALAERERMIVRYCAALIEAEVVRFGIDLPMSPREAADLLVSLGEGLTFSRMLDPTISAEVLGKTARMLFLDRASTQPQR